MHDLDAQGGAAGGQLPLGDGVRGEQRALAADQAHEGRAGALGDAQGGEFGVEASSLPASAFAGARHRPAVEGAEEENQAAEQPEGDGAYLGLAEGPRCLGYFFWAASARGCCWPA
jgi:hypothetical protein